MWSSVFLPYDSVGLSSTPNTPTQRRSIGELPGSFSGSDFLVAETGQSENQMRYSKKPSMTVVARPVTLRVCPEIRIGRPPTRGESIPCTSGMTGKFRLLVTTHATVPRRIGDIMQARALSDSDQALHAPLLVVAMTQPLSQTDPTEKRQEQIQSGFVRNSGGVDGRPGHLGRGRWKEYGASIWWSRIVPVLSYSSFKIGNMSLPLNCRNAMARWNHKWCWRILWVCRTGISERVDREMPTKRTQEYKNCDSNRLNNSIMISYESIWSMFTTDSDFTEVRKKSIAWTNTRDNNTAY